MDSQAKLEAQVRTAMELLVPKFRISEEERVRFQTPAIEVYDGRTLYHAIDNCIRFHPSDVDCPIVVGEEVSHYFHFQLRPPANNAFPTVFHALPVVVNREMIGRYGALAYLTSRDATPDVWRAQRGWADTATNTLDVLGHNLGYERAYRLFELHGEAYLPGLARMNVDDSLDLARRVAPISWYERKILPLFAKSRIDSKNARMTC